MPARPSCLGERLARDGEGRSPGSLAGATRCAGRHEPQLHSLIVTAEHARPCPAVGARPGRPEGRSGSGPRGGRSGRVTRFRADRPFTHAADGGRPPPPLPRSKRHGRRSAGLRRVVYRQRRAGRPHLLERRLERPHRLVQGRLDIVSSGTVVQRPTISDEEQPGLRHAARVDRIPALEPLGQLLERLRRPDELASIERRVGSRWMQRVAGVSDQPPDRPCPGRRELWCRSACERTARGQRTHPVRRWRPERNLTPGAQERRHAATDPAALGDDAAGVVLISK